MHEGPSLIDFRVLCFSFCIDKIIVRFEIVIFLQYTIVFICQSFFADFPMSFKKVLEYFCVKYFLGEELLRILYILGLHKI